MLILVMRDAIGGILEHFPGEAARDKADADKDFALSRK